MSDETRNWIPAMLSSQFVLFPSTAMPVTVSDPKNLAALRVLQEQKSRLLYIAIRKDEKAEALHDHLAPALCLAEVEFLKEEEPNEIQLLVRGMERQILEDCKEEAGVLYLTATPIAKVIDVDIPSRKAYLDAIKDLADQIIALLPGNMKQIGEMLRAIDEPELLVNLIAPHLEISIQRKLELLAEKSENQRLSMLLEDMSEMKQSLLLRVEIGRKVSHRFQKQQRDAMLRQQLKLIQEELGDGDASSPSAYQKRIEERKDLPDEIRKIALEEAQRLSSMERSSPEAPGLQNYLDLILNLPWSPLASAEIDLKKARQILESHHYGLQKVKDRILQHLAVLKLKANYRGSILLLLGPPGVGKTSLGRSIAEAMGREFVRASLGGVRDEAEIRGHRRTYVGSRPGRILQALKNCKGNNPVFLMDEIDKLSQGVTGDPAAALLEVLDPEQNQAFRDHYLEQAYDLSQVMFIATANSLEGIPAPLRDRLEIITLSSYTTAEKLHIAKQHLWPEALEQHGVKPEKLSLADEALLQVITRYTREAGVRELKRKLSALIRASTEAILSSEDKDSLRIEATQLDQLLGTEMYTLELAETHVPAGVVTGLAWTPMGGDILFIEAKALPGKGKLTLTGQMGEVMRESVQIAMSHVRSLMPGLGTRLDYEKTDIHVHVPAGAIPKDGPSAGVTMLTALASLFAQRAVSPSLAMTGEITLRGAVTAVGGVKEKVLAAHRAGIKQILLSERNRKDVLEVPEEVRNELTFIFVQTVADVLRETLGLECVDHGPQDLTLHATPPASLM